MYTQLRMIIGATALFLVPGAAAAQSDADAILGRWKATEKTLTIEVYRSGPEYRARLVDFTDHHNPVPASQRKDERNPDPALRDRPLLGLDVLTHMRYDADEKTWTGGTVYDVSSGKEYSAELAIDESGHMNVRAYKGVTMLGKTMRFAR